MADFVDEKKQEMQQRLKELRPLVEEYHRLEAAVAALAGVNSQPATTGGASASRAKRGPRPGQARPGRPKGSGPRAQQTLELIRSQPGVSIAELATTMGIKQNYLYRVVPGLQRDGLVRREGRGWIANEGGGDAS